MHYLRVRQQSPGTGLSSLCSLNLGVLMGRISTIHLMILTVLLFAGAVLAVSPAAAAPPVLNLPGTQSASEGNPLTFMVSATDPDGQTVSLFSAQRPTGATFVDHRDNTGTFDWTPDFGQAGAYTVLFLADDTFGGTDNGSVTINVAVQNAPPELTTIGNRNVDQGSTQFVSLSGYDSDGDALTFTASGLPSYATFTDYGDGSGNITLAPTLSTPPGPTSITVTLSDGTDSVNETFTVTVNGTQTTNAPILDAIGNKAVNEGQTTQVSISADDADGDVLNWTVSLPGFAALTTGASGPGTLSATITLAPGYCQAGSYEATVTVSDGVYQDSETFTITVVNSNRTPSWDASSYTATVPEGGTTNLSVGASDPDEFCGQGAPVLSVSTSDGGSALTATLTDAGNGSATLALSATPTAAGVYHVTLHQADRDNDLLGSNVVVTVTVTDVAAALAARAWTDADPIRLDIGKPRERFYLENVSGFALADVNLSSVRLIAWTNSGSVTSIAPLSDQFETATDRDHNGVLELRMEFGKDDLRALFANIGDRVSANMTLKATLRNGAELSVPVNVDVMREPKGVIKRLGPNPLNPETAVSIVLSTGGRLRVRVFDVTGKMVRTLVDTASAPAGLTVVRFDGRTQRGITLASGRYFVQAETDEGNDVTPLTIMK
jgi:hypothetical protein